MEGIWEGTTHAELLQQKLLRIAESDDEIVNAIKRVSQYYNAWDAPPANALRYIYYTLTL